ncbi:MAG: RsmB/NOP family class I SAM-dependent RNA methyltransferase [Rhodospirillaceae bacterium]|nr:MAG: RsmB/NOP family class I SAM-dependent RNA methyltransferase [Rhodospirillaceae bacterium]
MTPAGRLQTAIDLMDEILRADRPADGVVSAFFRARRFIGAKDRKAVASQVWRILRNRARLAWGLRADHVTAKLLVIADLIRADGKSVDALTGPFSGAKYEPEPMTAYERRVAERFVTTDWDAAPRHVRFELPEWLLEKFDRAFGDQTDAELAALGQEAGLDLRANVLKTTREDVSARLTAEELSPTPTPFSPWGLRLPARIAIGTHAGFKEGIFEVQDEASQLCALLVDAKPGMAVLDLCAGAGGKTLAMSAAMQNKGRIVACDVSIGRLERSKLRLRRAGAHNATLRILEDKDKWIGRQHGAFDRVLVDAPCSGTGAWRRNPDARWRLETSNLVNLKATQDAVLEQAAPLVKVGGRLVYATCSLLPEENAERITQFLHRHTEYRPVPVAEVWKAVLGSDCPMVNPGGEPFLTLTPARHGTDGFFVAILERVS